MAVTRRAQRARCTSAETIGEPMRQSRKSGILRELVALGLVIDCTSRPIAKNLVALSPSAGGRYGLRLRDRFHNVVRPVGVTKPKRKARSSGFSKSKKGYNGPGYQRTAIEICKKGIECTICAEVCGRRQFPEDHSLKGCNHESNICRICIARHTETQLAIDGKWRRVNCLQCQTKLGKDQVCKLIWRDDFERLVDFAKGKAVKADPRYRSCLSSSCDGGHIHRQTTSPIVTCKTCGSLSCYNHHVPWHAGYSCDRFDDSHPQAKSLRTSEERLKCIAKKCPGKGCGVYIEKDGGCNNMSCSRCGHIFDWGMVQYERRPSSFNISTAV